MGDFPGSPLVWIGVLSSFSLTSLFYQLYQEKKNELKELKEIPIFKADQHLMKVLQASPHKRLEYVAVEGLVQADGEPLASQFVPRCFGVIQKTTVTELWQNSFAKMWDSCTLRNIFKSQLLIYRETSNSVPFSLVSPGAYSNDLFVKVHNPLEASGSYLERVYNKVGRAEECFSNEIPIVTEETEELLRVGTTLTGFGEVVLEGGQVIRLQAPQDGRKYILVPSDHRSFMDRHEISARMWKSLTAFTGLMGTLFLGEVFFNSVGKQGGRSR
uniref:RING-type E3 ubiquitin transferase n=2 Tax=Anabas testudineus TaxID=64144 RepID=A0A3Q1HQT0_ANATE